MVASPVNRRREDSDKVVVTAHRGWSGRYPENTLLAFSEAVKLGVDMIEFDLQGSADDVPILLHDPTLERTTNGQGSPRGYPLTELVRLNASHWQPTFGAGYHVETPIYPEVTIPTFEQVLQLVGRDVGLNIHVKTITPSDAALLAEICRIYDRYDLYEQGYLAMNSFAEADMVRALNPRIPLCVLEGQDQITPEGIQRHLDYGACCMQPWRGRVTPELCAAARALGMPLNMFYSLSDADHRRYLGYGLRGILTDHPDILLRTMASLGLH